MPISRRTLLPFALTLGLGACAVNTPVLDYAYVSDNYAPYLLGYAAKQGGMPTEVTGNPFPAPTKAALDREVAESLTENHFGPEMNFVTAPLDASASYRVVVLFNPAPHANGAKLCSSDERPQVADSQGIGVLAAFCTTDQRINSVGGSIRGAAGPEDPAFKKLMDQLALQLFPPQYSTRSDRDSQFF